MAKLSVTIITLNEEANIKECLKSVRWADEIIVSDSGSSDRTVDICEEYGAKVFRDEWIGFGKQKNLCSERACNDWILNIDADERVTPELRVEIEKILQENGYDGFYIPRKSFFLGKWIRYCGWYPDYNLRLFRKGKGIFTERMVHESVKLKGNIAYLKTPLEHYTYKTISEYIQRMDRYAELAAKEMAIDGRKVNYLEIIFRPELAFLKMFFLKMGFLEGYRGVILSSLYAAYTFTKYAKLWEMRHNDV